MLSYLFSAQGRIGRGKFWLAVLISFLIYVAGEIAVPLIEGASFEQYIDENYTPGPAGWIILILSTVLGTWISFATGIKRCHDRGRSGWYILIAIIPIFGWIWYIVDLGMLKGDPGANKYGPNPFGIQNTAEIFA